MSSVPSSLMRISWTAKSQCEVTTACAVPFITKAAASYAPRRKLARSSAAESAAVSIGAAVSISRSAELDSEPGSPGTGSEKSIVRPSLPAMPPTSPSASAPL